MTWEDMTVSQLKEELKTRNLAVSGTKDVLIGRLAESDAATTSPGNEGVLGRIQAVAPFATIPVILTALGILVAGSTGAILYGDDLIDWIGGSPDYELIDFDPAQARTFAQGLVDLGHPEWEGRMSGTAEELAAAESNRNNFTEFGMGATLESFDVPMFEVLSTPTLSVCNPGSLGGFAPCSGPDLAVGGAVTTFEHRSDFVLQGYSGTNDIRYADRITVVDLGNGSEDAPWQDATLGVGVITGNAGVGSNTELYQRAAENDLYGLILVAANPNPEGDESSWPGNCKIPGEARCMPYFKSVDTSALSFIPDGISFIMVASDVGQVILDEVVNGDGLLAMFTEVDNQGSRSVQVPCGVIPGKTDDVIIFGAHHDTVYSGPGAIDDTSGSATVLELARQFQLIAEAKGDPTHTLKFCTWGGEEEGLHGSKAYVAKHLTDLQEHLRLYVNLDMNHADAERGRNLYLFGNDARDMEHVNGIVDKFKEVNPSGLASSYTIHTSTLDGAKGSANGMPYNSDHGPFVYDIQQDEDDPRGRAVVCYGSGSWEYHTIHDGMHRFNEESLAVSGIIYGSYVQYLAWDA